jgi:hypothetical protein
MQEIVNAESLATTLLQTTPEMTEQVCTDRQLKVSYLTLKVNDNDEVNDEFNAAVIPNKYITLLKMNHEV